MDLRDIIIERIEEIKGKGKFEHGIWKDRQYFGVKFKDMDFDNMTNEELTGVFEIIIKLHYTQRQ